MSLRDFNSSSEDRPIVLNHEPMGNGAGLGAFHTVNPEDREPTHTPKIIGALAVALMVGAAGAYVYSMSGKTMQPAAVQTASQCASYDAAKRAAMAATGWGDGPATHLAASAATGLVTTTATAPIDVVKTRMMVGAGVGWGGGGGPPSPWATAAALVRAEGPGALLKGWTAQYVRLGPQTVITFLVLERLRAMAGLAGL